MAMSSDLTSWRLGPTWLPKVLRRFAAQAESLVAITLALALAGGCSTTVSQSTLQTSTRPVVFVCEHGAARSVIAAAWFNKLAAERRLAIRAVARGVTPQDDLSASTVAGLRRDGVEFPSEKPRGLTKAEADDAAAVMTFYPLPPAMKPQRPESAYEVPAPGDGYDQSRDAILVHVKSLLDELQAH